jgi:hypothetical protein
MASFKSHPLFYTALIVAGAAAIGQSWLIFSQGRQADRTAAAIAQKRQTLESLSNRSVFPSRENVAAVIADRAAAERTRDEIRQLLRSDTEAARRIAEATVPASPTDAFFDIARFVEGVRDRAAAAQVLVGDKNRLGFETYVSTGPERDLIPLVFRQRQHVEYLLQALLRSEAKPREIISVQRERPISAEQRRQIEEAVAAGQPAPDFASSGAPGGSSSTGDFFTIDPRTSARVAGFVETQPYRIEFSGNTLSLRGFLNELAKFELPVVVRSVEVDPANPNATGSSASSFTPAPSSPFGGSPFGSSPFGAEASAAPVEIVKPLVEQTDSRFAVTVEFVALVDQGGTDASSSPEAQPANP